MTSTDPEVRHRLAAVVRSRIVTVSDELLPQGYPVWPDIDAFAGKPIAWTEDMLTDNIKRREYDAFQQRRTDLRDAWKPYQYRANDGWTTDQQLWLSGGLFPHFREAGRAYAMSVLTTTGDAAGVRRLLVDAVGVEQVANSTWTEAVGRLADYDRLTDFARVFPHLVNRRFQRATPTP